MLKKLVLSLLIVTAVSGSFLASRAMAVVQTEELIIMVPDAETGRNDVQIKNALTELAGVQVVGYCNTQKCFYLNVDRSLQPDNQNIISAIRELGYSMEIKISGTIQEAQSNCADRH